MSTLKVVGLQNPASGTVNGTLNADGTTTFNGVVTFATGQTFPSSSSTTPPSTPTQGSTWYDTGVTPPVLKVWNGTAWVPVSSSPSGTSAPSNPSSGTTWYDTSVVPPQMKVWNGSAWVPMPATATSTAPTSPTTGQQWTDTSQNPPVLKLWNGSAWVPATVALGTSAPTGTLTTGQLWSDTSTTPATLKAWNGSAWVAVQASGSGGIPSSLLTAKGSIISASAANTPVELTTGTNGQVLTVDTTTASGLKWAAAGGTGTVTNVTGTAPIVVATGTTTPAISFTNGNGLAIDGTAAKVSIGSASAVPTVSTAAADAMTGSMYWDDVAGAMFYRYDNGGSPVWVQASAGGGGSSASDWTRTGTVLAPTTSGDTVQFSAGTAALPGISFVGDPNTGFYNAGANLLGISTNGVGNVFVDPSGRLLVGSSTAATGTNTQYPSLQIVGNSAGGANYGSIALLRNEDSANITLNEVISSIEFGDRQAGEYARIQANADGAAGSSDYPGRLSFFTTPDGSATPVERIRVTSAGKFISGSTTTVPTGTSSSLSLNIFKGNTTSTFGGAYVTLANNSNTTGVSVNYGLGTLVFSDSEAGEYGIISCLADANAAVGNTPGRLVFSTTPSGSATPVEALRVNSSQQVLIGMTTSSDTGSGLNAGNVKTFRTFTGQKTQAANTGNLAQIATSGWLLNTGANIAGEITSEVTSADTGSNAVLAMTRAVAVGPMITFYNSALSQVGSISIAAASTSYNTSSDYRLKENVVPLDGAVDRLKQLPVHRFNFIADPDTTVDGFLAHEAQTVVPECVTGEKDAVDEEGNPVYQGIDQSKLVPLLTAALQEALAEIESLKARLDAAGL